MVVEDGETCNKYIVLIMNDKLSQLLKSTGINKLIQHKMVALGKLFHIIDTIVFNILKMCLPF